MTLTLTGETETRLLVAAEERGLDPAELHEDLLRQALAQFSGTQPAEHVLTDLTTDAAMAGPIFDLWSSPEEDDAWKHLSAHE